MAKDKNSFILYTDLIHTISKVPDDVAGKLFKTILAYVNDLNPETEDLLLQVLFEPIKQQLKRDLRTWEEFKEKQRLNGFKGGRPKNQPQKEETQINPKNPSLILETQKSLNVTVNDTVNDTVNVIDTVNVNDKKIQKPTREEFLNHCKTLTTKFEEYKYSFGMKYDTWVADGWKDGNGKKIKNWKLKISNTLPYLKPFTQSQPVYTPPTKIKSVAEMYAEEGL